MMDEIASEELFVCLNIALKAWNSSVSFFYVYIPTAQQNIPLLRVDIVRLREENRIESQEKKTEI